ncbi:retrovirus-related pol polyprotein from transposon TNT 1-94 [Tanacetum coccineum]
MPSEWNTHVVVWRNKPDLDTMSFDDLYNNFKIVEQEVKGTTNSSSSSSSQNMAFMSSPSSTNEVNTAYGVGTDNTQVSSASTKVSTPSTQVSTANLSEATVYAFLANQPNGSQLVHEDLEQVHKDDLEEMDLKWQLALLSMRTRKFFQKTGRKITINGSDTAGYDKSKVEYFNCHKMGHFARECKGPRNQDSRNWNQDSSRRTVNVEETSSKAMLAIDGADFDWSYMTDDEVPTNMALMNFSDSGVHNDKTCSKTCLKSFETLKTQLDDLRIEFNKSEFNLATYKRGLASIEEQLVFYKKNEIIFCEQLAILKRDVSYKDSKISVLKSELEKLKQEKESNQLKIENFDNASKGLDKLIGSQITDKSRKADRDLDCGTKESVGRKETMFFVGHPQKEDQGYVDSGYSMHMTGNMSYLSDLKEFDRGHVTFGGGAKGGRIAGKGTLKDVYFVKELQFNLFSVSQMCDKKNSVLFTDTECFVLSPDFKLAVENRVLVVKPHNKTPYELFRGRTPSLSFMRPFGCHVTILNTLDYLGKFDGKSDEGFFVGYSLNSKDFRVYNIKTRKVKENLHVRFLEDKPIIAGDGPKWIFDIDVLTKSIIYVPVVAGTNSNDFVGTKESIGAGQSSKKIGSSKDYILMPLWKDGSVFDSSSKNASNDEPKPSNDAGKKDDEGGIDDQERPENCAQDFNTVGPIINTASTNFNTGSLNINTASPTVTTAPLEATHADFFDDKTELDISNIITTYLVPTTLNTRIHKDRSLDHAIGDVQSGVQIRRMTKNTNEQGFISVVYEGKTHEDLHTCLFACFLSQEEPKKVIQALKDPSWITALCWELNSSHLVLPIQRLCIAQDYNCQY